MKHKLLIATAILLMPSTTTLAGGEPEAHSDVFVARPTLGNQTLVGGAQVPGDLNLEERIFEGDLETDSISGNNIYSTTEPGFFNAGSNSPGLLGATNPAGSLPLTPGESFVVNNVPFDLDGLTADLFYWNGAGAVTFADSSADLVITQTDAIAASDGSIDDHPIFDIDDPASLDLPAGGIYLAPMTVELNGLTPSDPILVLFVTGAQFEDSVEMAEGFLAARLVPEPSALVIVSLAMVASLFALRR
ncbi:MAG: hypothetical protein ACR2NU_01660 [Aeoliella sp.]